jgi:hypothetical protein
MNRIRKFLRLDTLGGLLQSGIVPDKSAMFGMFAVLNNAGAYCGHLETITTAGTNTTLTASQCRRRVIRLESGASGGFTITLPSTSAIISALGSTMITDGTYGQPFMILNDSVGQTGTLTAGDASTTITGTATITTATTRYYFMMLTSATTITYFNVGSLTL